MQNLPTERPWRKYIMRHACLRFEARQDYLSEILLPISRMGSEKKAKIRRFCVKRLSFRVKNGLFASFLEGTEVSFSARRRDGNAGTVKRNESPSPASDDTKPGDSARGHVTPLHGIMKL
jgi:hypothetical protein